MSRTCIGQRKKKTVTGVSVVMLKQTAMFDKVSVYIEQSVYERPFVSVC